MTEFGHIKLTRMAKRAGDAAKHPPGYLPPLLGQLPALTDPNVLVGSATADDAAIDKSSDDLALVLTTDFFTPKRQQTSKTSASGPCRCRCAGRIFRSSRNSRSTSTMPAIASEADCERLLEAAERLIDKGAKKSREEGELLSLLATPLEHYEEAPYPVPEVAPHEVLRHLMEERELSQADLLPVFKSRGYVSDALSGARPINAGKARALAELFGVSPGLFI